MWLKVIKMAYFAFYDEFGGPIYAKPRGVVSSAPRENWLQIEQQIRSAATELEIMPLLDGIYVVKPLFPKIPITKFRYEMVNAPVSPGGTVPRTPGGANRLQIPRLDANGQKIFSTELIDPAGDPAGPRR
jgi:hypothetical protein